MSSKVPQSDSTASASQRSAGSRAAVGSAGASVAGAWAPRCANTLLRHADRSAAGRHVPWPSAAVAPGAPAKVGPAVRGSWMMFGIGNAACLCSTEGSIHNRVGRRPSERNPIPPAERRHVTSSACPQTRRRSAKRTPAAKLSQPSSIEQWCKVLQAAAHLGRLVLEAWEVHDAVVAHDANKQHGEAQQLQPLEMLPAHHQRHHPHHEVSAK